MDKKNKIEDKDLSKIRQSKIDRGDISEVDVVGKTELDDIYEGSLESTGEIGKAFGGISGDKINDLYNFDLDISIRMEILNKLYEEIQGDIFEILKKFIGIYQLSGGVSSISIFIKQICIVSNLDIFLKFECIKCLLNNQRPIIIDFNPFEDDPDDLEEAAVGDLEEAAVGDLDLGEAGRRAVEEAAVKGGDFYIDEKTTSSLIEGWIGKINEAFDILYQMDFNGLPSLCKLEFVYYLMESENNDHINKSVDLLMSIVCDKNIPVDYRYKILNSLDKKTGVIFNNKISDYIIKSSFIRFIEDDQEESYYKCLGIQYLYRYKENFEITDFSKMETILIDMAKDELLEYNRRADAADTLYNIGSDESKKKAKDILSYLGNINGRAKTFFENSQNVHSISIEKSVLESIKSILSTHTTKNYSFEKIKNKLKKISAASLSTSEKPVAERSTILGSAFKYENIKMALNRIYLDNILYSEFNITICKVFEKVFSIAMEHENKEELFLRIFQELADMADTCSSGYISRIVNILSGYLDTIRISWEEQIISNFNGRINFLMRQIPIIYGEEGCIFKEDKKRKILSIYFDRKKTKLWDINELNIIQMIGKATGEKVSDVIARMYLENGIIIPTKKIKKIIEVVSEEEFELNKKKLEMLIESREDNAPTSDPPVTWRDSRAAAAEGDRGSAASVGGDPERIEQTDKDRADFFKKCLESFQKNVMNEITISSSIPFERKHFLIFFADVMPIIREEMYNEFSGYIKDTEFDSYFKLAICSYEK